MGARILLHACCGPCSLAPARILRERGQEPVIFYANSNIAPAREYAHRLDTLRTWAASIGVSVAEGAYDPAAWEHAVGSLGDEIRAKFGLVADEHAAAFAQMHDEADTEHFPAVGNLAPEARAARCERCRACYRLRFEEAARYAADHGFDALGTTLSVSPHKNAAKLNELGGRLSDEYKIPYLYSDFKKRNGYKRSIELSAQYGLYRQNYCGCIYSRIQAEKKEQEKNFQNETKTVVKP